MTMTTTKSATMPRRPELDRTIAMRLAATEYGRVVELLRSLPATSWERPTDCPGWDVRALASHMLGMAEMAATVREGLRQTREAGRRGGVFIDELTGIQVEERLGMRPAEIVERFAVVGPRAARGRRRVPGLLRRRPMPATQLVGGVEEAWSMGYLVDVILTRDPWMHRIDICRATGAELILTAEHDGVLVADVVAEWAQRHGRPCELRLTGPAGGSWVLGTGGARLEMDAVEFCRRLSGRVGPDPDPVEPDLVDRLGPDRHGAAGLLAVEVPF